MISYGFVLHDGAFCRSAFNLLDLLVVFVSLIAMFIRYVEDLIFRYVMPIKITSVHGLKQKTRRVWCVGFNLYGLSVLPNVVQLFPGNDGALLFINSQKLF